MGRVPLRNISEVYIAKPLAKEIRGLHISVGYQCQKENTVHISLNKLDRSKNDGIPTYFSFRLSRPKRKINAMFKGAEISVLEGGYETLFLVELSEYVSGKLILYFLSSIIVRGLNN